MHAGVMKQVGEAVHDHLVAHGSKARLVVIGIATWGCVKGKKSLVKDGVGTIGSIKSNSYLQLWLLKSKCVFCWIILYI